jgi:solute carrier family 13 (sodium-dependent dicarboxylate transporter), member 2/3/5
MNRRTRDLLLGVVVAALAGGAALRAGLGADAAWAAATAGLCATWWVLEPIPIPATSLVPLVALPLTGVMPHGEVATAYGHWIILLLLGGFILSTAVERSGAHRRLAFGMVRLTGGQGRRLVLGFMLASAVCSMWISNTATTLMLLPVAIAVVKEVGETRLAVPLLLGIAYSASIGGLATPIGTPPNVIFMGMYEAETGVQISFVEWMGIGLPVVVVFLPLVWLYLSRRVGSIAAPSLPELDAWRPAEKRVLIVFGVTACAWIFRTAPFGGWSELIGAEYASDTTVAMAAVVAMFLIPNGEGDRLLDWETAVKIPWGMLLLFGGGLAIAGAFQASGLSEALGMALSHLASAPIVIVTLVICLGVTFLTEVTSNTATATVLLPILGAAAVAAGLDPAALMIPATLSASCAFMLPVATAPNAAVYGSGYVSPKQMAREGFALNLIGAVVITAVCMILL